MFISINAGKRQIICKAPKDIINNPTPNHTQSKLNSSSSSRNSPDDPPRALTHDLDPALLLQTPNRICELRAFDRNRATLAQSSDQVSIPHTTVATTNHLIEHTQQASLQILPPLPLASASTFGQQSHINETGAGVCCGLLESGLDEADSFVDIVFRDSGGEAHFGVRFGQTDHAFELTGGGGDAALGGADVFSQLAHGNVGGHEGFASGGRDGGLHGVAGVGDVGGEELDGLDKSELVN